MSLMKECSVCHEVKDAETEYYRVHSGRFEGFVQTYCRSCQTKKVQLSKQRRKAKEGATS